MKIKNLVLALGIGLIGYGVYTTSIKVLTIQPEPGLLAGKTLATIVNYDSVNYGCLVNTPPDSLAAKLRALQQMGLQFTRGTVVLQNWAGKNANIDYFIKNGITPAINLNWNIQGTKTPYPIGPELEQYSTLVKAVTEKYPCKLFVIENEELNKSYHSGTYFQYIDMLLTAGPIIHSSGGTFTNGGVTLKMSRILTYRDLKTTYPDSAEKFLINCIPAADTSWIKTKGTRKQEQQILDQINLLNWYSRSNLDYVNLHIYLPIIERGNNTVNTGLGVYGLNSIIGYISRITGKPVISNEFGLMDQNYDLVQNSLNTINSEGLKYCILYSGHKAEEPFVNNKGLTVNGLSVSDYMKNKK